LARDWLSVVVTDTRVAMEESLSIDIPVSNTIPANTDVSSSTGGLSVAVTRSCGTSDLSVMDDPSVMLVTTGPCSVPSLGVSFYFTPAAFAMMDLVTVVDTTLGFVD
jgi:hypothetical protein